MKKEKIVDLQKEKGNETIKTNENNAKSNLIRKKFIGSIIERKKRK